MNDRKQPSVNGAFYAYAATVAFKAKSKQLRPEDRQGLRERVDNWLSDDPVAHEVVERFERVLAEKPEAAGAILLDGLGRWADTVGIRHTAPETEATLQEQTPTHFWPERSPDPVKPRRRRKSRKRKKKDKAAAEAAPIKSGSTAYDDLFGGGGK